MKNSTKGYIILGILFALISVAVFAIPTSKTSTFWIAYVFTAAAFAAQIPIWKIALGKDEMLKSKFLGFPVVYIGIVYVIIQVITFSVFLFVPTLPVWSAIVVCAVIEGVSAVCMVASDVGRGEIERVDSRVHQKVSYIRELQTEVELLANAETDSAIKAALLQLAEKFRFSDPTSNEQLTNLEDAISEKVALLKTLSDKNEIIGEIDLLLSKRNKMCKMLK